MRVLQVHNFYQQPGGEDQVFAAEYGLLTSRGHFVTQYTAHNDSLSQVSALRSAAQTIWNNSVYNEIRRILSEQSFDIVHAHNTFPLISPALYYAARSKGVPVVQTLHNYRLICPAATLFRSGAVCEECIGSVSAYHGVIHRCYRGSLPASAMTSALLLSHRAAGTWDSRVDTYIALTEFSRNKFIEGGLPAERIKVKPNFLPEDPGVGGGSGHYALFAGRLAREKGLETLLEAWEKSRPAVQLRIAGDGPLRPLVEERARQIPGVQYLGACEHSAVLRLLQDAAFLIFPSEWYEGMPLVIIEALACGTPVLTSSLGSMIELIEEGVSGLRFAPRDPRSLAACVQRFLEISEPAALRLSARAFFEKHFTPAKNYQLLLEIYRNVLSISG
jgi:glycosyltransferase involved in cell wall biosynthesis